MILGITASHGLGARAGGDFESISTVTVGAGGQSTITFSSVPQTYKHLQIRYITANTVDAYYVRLQFNGDSATSSYTSNTLFGNGSTVTSTAYVNNNAGLLNPRNSSTANIFATGIVDILDYTNTNKYTTTRSIGGFDLNGSGYVEFFSGVWLNTNAITSITASAISGNFAQYSNFALYGIKG